MTSAISRLIALTIAGGVPLGMSMPCHPVSSYPGTNSAIAGRSGKIIDRLALVTANARTRPDFSVDMAVEITENETCTRPASRSGAAPAPLL